MESAIYELKGIDLKKLKQDSPLDRWFYEMVQKNVNMLTITDVSHMLRQEVYLDIAIPLAWKYLLNNPLCGEMYDGQMLELLTRVFINDPNLKEVDFYAAFEEMVQQVCEIYQCDNDYEELILELRQLFE